MGAAAGGLDVAAGGPRAAAGGQAELAALSPSSPQGLSLSHSRRLKMKGREKDKTEGSSRGEYGF